MTRLSLKAVLKALSDAQPSNGALNEIPSREFTRRSVAKSIRQRASYSMADVPIVHVNSRAKVDRGIPDSLFDAIVD